MAKFGVYKVPIPGYPLPSGNDRTLLVHPSQLTDGNLSPLLNTALLTVVAGSNKKHYSHTDKEITRMLREPLCAELSQVLGWELHHGNQLQERPIRSDWPKPGSVFASLKQDLTTAVSSLPRGVTHVVNTDIHYGWHDECYCTIHDHLLVAGATHAPSKLPSHAADDAVLQRPRRPGFDDLPLPGRLQY